MRWTAIAIWGVLLGAPALARGQQADDVSRSAARAIGTAGVEAFQRGDYATASEKLDKAYQVLKVPSLGLWSARSRAKLGKLVSAAERYREVMRLVVSDGDVAVQKQAQQDASTDLDVLTPRIPSVVIQLQGSAAAGAGVSIDGVVVSSALVGEPCPLDPGKHVIEAQSSAGRARSEVTIAEGESKPVVLSLQAADTRGLWLPASTPAANPPVGAVAAPPPKDSAASGPGLGTQKTLAIASGGIGVVGVAVGSIFGLQAMSNHADAKGHCAGAACSDSAGFTSAQDAYKDGTISTVAFAVGLVGLAGGAALWFTAKPNETAVGLAPGMIQLRRTW
ncbi:MAG TPA: hypothetical protein VGM29_09740 [Polyangiaceae bacterium]|jgi:hypothetical protein